MPETSAAAIFSGLSPSALNSVTFTDDDPALMDKMTVDFAIVCWTQCFYRVLEGLSIARVEGISINGRMTSHYRQDEPRLPYDVGVG